jgi:hypothetical protein
VVLDEERTKGIGADRVRNELTRTLGHGDKLCVYGVSPERQLLEYCECLDGVDYIDVHAAVCHAMGMDPHGYHRRPSQSILAPCPIASNAEMMEQLRNGVYAEVVQNWNVTSYPHVAARSRLEDGKVDDPSFMALLAADFANAGLDGLRAAWSGTDAFLEGNGVALPPRPADLKSWYVDNPSYDVPREQRPDYQEPKKPSKKKEVKTAAIPDVAFNESTFVFEGCEHYIRDVVSVDGVICVDHYQKALDKGDFITLVRTPLEELMSNGTASAPAPGAMPSPPKTATASAAAPTAGEALPAAGTDFPTIPFNPRDFDLKPGATVPTTQPTENIRWALRLTELQMDEDGDAKNMWRPRQRQSALRQAAAATARRVVAPVVEPASPPGSPQHESSSTPTPFQPEVTDLTYSPPPPRTPSQEREVIDVTADSQPSPKLSPTLPPSLSPSEPMVTDSPPSPTPSPTLSPTLPPSLPPSEPMVTDSQPSPTLSPMLPRRVLSPPTTLSPTPPLPPSPPQSITDLTYSPPPSPTLSPTPRSPPPRAPAARAPRAESVAPPGLATKRHRPPQRTTKVPRKRVRLNPAEEPDPVALA